MRVENLDTAPSTNTWMTARADAYGHGDVVAAREQTAGRGQRGNTWEAEPGRNLTFSLMLRPAGLRAADAFLLSMAVSVGIVRGLSELMPEVDVEVKWPNDIYVGDLKLAGILIENSFEGSTVGRSVVGIGLNVNQSRFVSDAPNPVSMLGVTGREYNLDDVLRTVVARIVGEVDSFMAAPDAGALLRRYHSMLWRRLGEHRWRDNLRGEDITAAIASVAPTGHLTLATTPPRTYAFKEVAAIL